MSGIRPGGLVKAQLPDGFYLVAGQSVSAFTRMSSRKPANAFAQIKTIRPDRAPNLFDLDMKATTRWQRLGV